VTSKELSAIEPERERWNCVFTLELQNDRVVRSVLRSLG